MLYCLVLFRAGENYRKRGFKVLHISVHLRSTGIHARHVHVSMQYRMPVRSLITLVSGSTYDTFHGGNYVPTACTSPKSPREQHTLCLNYQSRSISPQMRDHSRLRTRWVYGDIGLPGTLLTEQKESTLVPVHVQACRTEQRTQAYW